MSGPLPRKLDPVLLEGPRLGLPRHFWGSTSTSVSVICEAPLVVIKSWSPIFSFLPPRRWQTPEHPARAEGSCRAASLDFPICNLNLSLDQDAFPLSQANVPRLGDCRPFQNRVGKERPGHLKRATHSPSGEWGVGCPDPGRNSGPVTLKLRVSTHQTWPDLGTTDNSWHLGK